MKLLNTLFLLILSASVLAQTDASAAQNESPPLNLRPQPSESSTTLTKDVTKTSESARVSNGGPAIEAKTANESNDAEQNPLQLPLCMPVRIIEELPKSDDAKRRADHTCRNEDQDLQAQQSMARSAKSQLKATYIVIAISFLGTGFLIWTICETRKAANAAQGQLVTMGRQLELAEKEFATANGPRLYVAGVRAVNFDGGKSPIIILKIVNGGNVIARDVFIHMNVAIYDRTLVDWDEEQRVTIPANSPRECYVDLASMISRTQLDRSPEGSGNLEITGYFRHGETREEFCYKYNRWPYEYERPREVDEFVPCGTSFHCRNVIAKGQT